jgi:hypothetical protein
MSKIRKIGKIVWGELSAEKLPLVVIALFLLLFALMVYSEMCRNTLEQTLMQ